MAQPDAKKSDKKLNDKVKEIAGTAEFLRRVPKHFATLKAVDPARGCVTFLIEGKIVKVNLFQEDLWLAWFTVLYAGERDA